MAKKKAKAKSTKKQYKGLKKAEPGDETTIVADTVYGFTKEKQVGKKK